MAAAEPPATPLSARVRERRVSGRVGSAFVCFRGVALIRSETAPRVRQTRRGVGASRTRSSSCGCARLREFSGIR